MGLKHTLTHTHYYVYKTYGRDSRSQEIGTSRESRDRCHLLRARIRHADVDQFVYQRQRLIFKGIYQHHRRVDYVVRRLDGCSIRLGEQSQGFVPGESGHLCFHGDSNATRTVSGKHRVFEVVDDEGEERKLLEVYRTQNPRIAKRDEGSAAISVRRHRNRHPKRPRKTRFVRTFEKGRRIVASYLELEASQNGGQSEGRSVPKSARQSNGGFEQRLRQEGDQIGERSRANRAV